MFHVMIHVISIDVFVTVFYAACNKNKYRKTV